MLSRRNPARSLAAILAAGAALLAVTAAPALADSLTPPAGKVFFGISDTGDPANFGEFSLAASKHPAVIESFRSWGSDFTGSIRRWQTARARPMLHITTADPQTGGEIITPRQIAEGDGDEYLIRLNKLFWAKKMPAYVRPLGEPNRCLNVYASYDCAGVARGGDHTPRWYKLAFRRIYILLHGGGKAVVINSRLAEAGLPPMQSNVAGLPAAPIAVIWSPLPAGSPTTPANRPRHFYPGSRYTDWAGTDFYSGYADWKSLTGLYERFKGKPFVLTEWAVESSEEPDFVRRLFTWVERHPRCRMLVYYQDFGTTSSYRIENYPQSLNVLRARLHSPVFPAYAPDPPHLPPPPPGGVAPAPTG